MATTRTYTTGRSSRRTASAYSATPRATYTARSTNRVTVDASTSAASARATSASRTSSFSRFATPVDYWSGSTAPDFAYWDELSAREAGEWSEAGAGTRATSRTASAKASRTSSAPASRNANSVRLTKDGISAAGKSISDATAQMTARANEIYDSAVALPKTLPAPLVLAVAMSIIIVSLAIICFVRIGWSSDTVSLQVKSQELSQTISSTRDAGRVLEVQKSSAANASNIRSQAIFLGMMEPETTESLFLDPDTVTVDAAGNLSLSGSVARVVQAAR